MRSASTGFARSVAGAHQIATRCDVLFDREVIAEDVGHMAGQITFDRTRAVLADLNLDLIIADRVPLSATDYYTPYGYELRVWRGVYVNGTPELVALGTFPIQRSSLAGRSKLTHIVAEDRSRLVLDARFEDTYQVSSGTNYATAIEALITDGVTGLEFEFPTTTYTTPALTFFGQDNRWEAAQNMAASIGMDLHFDGLGRCVMRPEPTFSTDPVFAIAEAANLTDGNLLLDRAEVYNKVIAESSNASVQPPVSGSASDDNPESPTFYSSTGFGLKPKWHRSPFYTTTAQCAAGAAAVLAAGLGSGRRADCSAVPDPRIEAGDVGTVTYGNLSLDGLHIVDGGVIGLAADDGLFTLNVRSQQEAS